jgi:hypothetical protein
MNEQLDPWEMELLAVRPQSLSAEARQRIAERLAEPVPRRSQWVWGRLLAGSLSAACLTAIAWSWIGGQHVKPPPQAATSQPSDASLVDVAGPTLLAYQRALARSPEDFEVLLNRHVLATQFPEPLPVPVGAFTRSDAALHALLGDD